MAGEVSKKELGTVLMQAMMAAKNLRPQRDRLLHLHRRLQRFQSDLIDGFAYLGVEISQPTTASSDPSTD